MSQHEFIKYEPTPNEEHAGLATVRLYSKIILRYKIVPKKDGTGYFPTPASYKVQDVNGNDSYVAAFMLDSNYDNISDEMDKEEIESLIMSNVKRIMTNKNQDNTTKTDQLPF